MKCSVEGGGEGGGELGGDCGEGLEDIVSVGLD